MVTIEHCTDDFAAANPVSISKWSKNELVIRIENALKDSVDEATALGMDELKSRVFSNNERKIRDTIVDMDLNGGYTIIATTKGYFNCKTMADYIKWHQFNYSYIEDMSHRVKIVGQNLQKQLGQKGFQTKLWGN